MQRLATDCKTSLLVPSRRSAAQDVQTPAGMTLAARLAIAIVAAAALIGWWIWRIRKKTRRRDLVL